LDHPLYRSSHSFMLAHLCGMITIGFRCRRAANSCNRSWNVGGLARRRTYAVMELSSPSPTARIALNLSKRSGGDSRMGGRTLSWCGWQFTVPAS
jgi:hypothetical protein